MPDGTYELISGHRRKRASEILGLPTLPVIVRDVDHDTGTVMMVDSNFQRETILPSERAFAYKMKMEAMNRQGQRNDLTSTQGVQKLSVEKIAEENNESRETVRRFIRLTYLIPELLQLVDNKVLVTQEETEQDENKESILKMAMLPAVEISYLTEDEQYMLLDAIEMAQATPSHAQARLLRDKSEKRILTDYMIEDIMAEQKPNQKLQVKFQYENIKQYFPDEFTPEQMQDKIQELLKDYKREWQKERRKEEYAR